MKSRAAVSAPLLSILKKFSGCRIAVAGDFMLDHFIWGRASRLSAEAPVAVVESTGETFHPGGAGNVAANLAALGARVSPFGVTGADRPGKQLRAALQERAISTDGLLAVAGRATTVKLRIIETGHRHQIARVDTETRSAVTAQQSRRLADALLGGRFDAVIVSDYDKGTLTPEFLARVLPELRRRGTPVFLDPRTRQPQLYRPISVMTPNRSEAERITGIDIRDDESLRQAAAALLQMTEGEAVLITLSDQGMLLFEKSGRAQRISTVSREVYDVTGAGDTVIATFALACAAGASFIDAARLANHAAGIAVGHVGTAAPRLEELRAAL